MEDVLPRFFLDDLHYGNPAFWGNFCFNVDCTRMANNNLTDYILVRKTNFGAVKIEHTIQKTKRDHACEQN